MSYLQCYPDHLYTGRRIQGAVCSRVRHIQVHAELQLRHRLLLLPVQLDDHIIVTILSVYLRYLTLQWQLLITVILDVAGTVTFCLVEWEARL